MPVHRAPRRRRAVATRLLSSLVVVLLMAAVHAQDDVPPADLYQEAVRELLTTPAGRAFLEAYIAIQRDYLYGVDLEVVLEGATAGLVAALDDPLTHYLYPDEAVAARRANAASGVEAAQLGDVALIRISTFEGEGVGNKFAVALDGLLGAGARGIVLDLRGNEGGSILQGLQVLDRFLSDGELGFRRVRGVSVPIAYANPRSITHPLIVLVDEGTSSTAEIVAGTLQAYGRARLVGTTTAGKGVGQTAMRLADGAELRLVTFEWLLPGLRSIDGVGLTPDVLISTSPADPIQGEDPRPLVTVPEERGDAALRIALEALRSLLGDQLDVGVPALRAPTSDPGDPGGPAADGGPDENAEDPPYADNGAP